MKKKSFFHKPSKKDDIPLRLPKPIINNYEIQRKEYRVLWCFTRPSLNMERKHKTYSKTQVYYIMQDFIQTKESYYGSTTHIFTPRGHSKSTFAQDSRVLIPHHLIRPCSFQSTSSSKVRSLMARTHPLPLNIYTCEIQRKEINNQYQYLSLNSTCLLRSHSGISIKWTPLVHDKSVHFMEMSPLQRVHLKIKSLQKQT